MPNSNYVRGRRKEWKIRKELINEGCDIAQRSAGSHSPIDVFAIRKSDKKIILIQSKPKNFSERETKEIMDSWGWLNGVFDVEFIIR